MKSISHQKMTSVKRLFETTENEITITNIFLD